jgi:2-polyprenyl-3-methyl-5-hydroxy-6-metoxy-1,4-benzoquinol methylase
MLRRNRVCPWWMAYTFDNPLRRLVHNPQRMLGPYVHEGMTVLDAGCGMGYFSLGMAQLVGPEGIVVSVDLQEKMLESLKRRARRAGLLERIRPRLSAPDDLHVTEELDFALAFWMVHEVPNTEGFFRQVRAALKPGGSLLVAEPRFHVSQSEFEDSLATADKLGFRVRSRPHIFFSRAALLEAV